MIENKKILEKLRKMRAFAIIAKGDTPKVMQEGIWVIPSQSNPDRAYTITHEQNGWTCNCPDYIKNEGEILCKHIQAIQMYQKFQDGMDDVLALMNDERAPQCPECDNIDVVRNGTRRTHMGKRQRYLCKQCGYRFTVEIISNRKANTKLIALCMDLYFKGLSLRKISDTIEQFYDMKVHFTTIRLWVNTFMNKINEYVSKYNPDLGEVWNIDEQKVKSGGDWVYSWNALDEKTRFLIANSATKERSLEETEKLFHEAKGNVEGKPRMIVTDKMNSYHGVIKNEFPESIHIQAGIRDAINNNKLERFHGTWRERDKVMRGLQNDITTEQMLENYRTYYNFVRKHQTLGKTPSEMANIDLELGKNKWVGLIEKSMEVVQ